MNSTTEAPARVYKTDLVDTIALVFLYTLEFVVGFCANLLYIALIYRYRKLRTRPNLILLNLISADLARTIVNCPYHIFGALATLGEPTPAKHGLCKTVLFLSYQMGFTCMLSMSMISTDRLIAIAFPYFYRDFVTHNTFIAMSVIVWVQGIITTLPAAIVDDWMTYRGTKPFLCGFGWESVKVNYILSVITINFLLPFIQIVSANLVVFTIARAQLKRIKLTTQKYKLRGFHVPDSNIISGHSDSINKDRKGSTLRTGSELSSTFRPRFESELSVNQVDTQRDSTETGENYSAEVSKEAIETGTKILDPDGSVTGETNGSFQPCGVKETTSSQKRTRVSVENVRRNSRSSQKVALTEDDDNEESIEEIQVGTEEKENDRHVRNNEVSSIKLNISEFNLHGNPSNMDVDVQLAKLNRDESAIELTPIEKTYPIAESQLSSARSTPKRQICHPTPTKVIQSRSDDNTSINGDFNDQGLVNEVFEATAPELRKSEEDSHKYGNLLKPTATHDINHNKSKRSSKSIESMRRKSDARRKSSNIMKKLKMAQKQKSQSTTELQIAYSTLLLIIYFVLSWTPFAIPRLYIRFNIQGIPDRLIIYGSLFPLSTIMWDPLVIFVCRREIRRCLRRFLSEKVKWISDHSEGGDAI